MCYFNVMFCVEIVINKCINVNIIIYSVCVNMNVLICFYYIIWRYLIDKLVIGL